LEFSLSFAAACSPQRGADVLNQMTKLNLREGLVRTSSRKWLRPRRAFRLAGAGEIGVNRSTTPQVAGILMERWSD